MTFSHTPDQGHPDRGVMSQGGGSEQPNRSTSLIISNVTSTTLPHARPDKFITRLVVAQGACSKIVFAGPGIWYADYAGLTAAFEPKKIDGQKSRISRGFVKVGPVLGPNHEAQIHPYCGRPLSFPGFLEAPGRFS